MSKHFLIDEHFKRWHQDVARTKELIDGKRHYLEGILALSCYLGALAAMRYPALRDGEAYVRIVMDYSGLRNFYEQIDLLFLFQWPRSKLKNHGHYKELKQHPEIVAALTKVYGSENDIKQSIRYVPQADVIDIVSAAGILSFDEVNLREKLRLFSLAEMLYRYLRCDAVHNADFPLINESSDAHGNISYKENHAITAAVLMETVTGVINNLHADCIKSVSWPHEL